MRKRMGTDNKSRRLGSIDLLILASPESMTHNKTRWTVNLKYRANLLNIWRTWDRKALIRFCQLRSRATKCLVEQWVCITRTIESPSSPTSNILISKTNQINTINSPVSTTQKLSSCLHKTLMTSSILTLHSRDRLCLSRSPPERLRMQRLLIPCRKATNSGTTTCPTN